MTEHVHARPVAADHPDIPPGQLWFGLVAAPLAWIAEGLFGWFFGARICTAYSIPTVRLVIGGFSVLMLAVALGGVVVGLRSWRTAQAAATVAADRVEFMALGGVLVSTSFAVGIFWSGLSAAVLNVCGWMR